MDKSKDKVKSKPSSVAPKSRKQRSSSSKGAQKRNIRSASKNKKENMIDLLEEDFSSAEFNGGNLVKFNELLPVLEMIENGRKMQPIYEESKAMMKDLLNKHKEQTLGDIRLDLSLIAAKEVKEMDKDQK